MTALLVAQMLQCLSVCLSVRPNWMDGTRACSFFVVRSPPHIVRWHAGQVPNRKRACQRKFVYTPHACWQFSSMALKPRLLHKQIGNAWTFFTCGTAADTSHQMVRFRI